MTKTNASNLRRQGFPERGTERIMNDLGAADGICVTCSSPLDHCRCFTVGDQVRFREALDPGDDLCLFDVIEDNGTRLMIRLVCDLPIPPVKVVRRADMCKSQR